MADTCIFVMSCQADGIDTFGSKLLEIIYSFHLPASLFVAQVFKIRSKLF